MDSYKHLGVNQQMHQRQSACCVFLCNTHFSSFFQKASRSAPRRPSRPPQVAFTPATGRLSQVLRAATGRRPWGGWQLDMPGLRHTNTTWWPSESAPHSIWWCFDVFRSMVLLAAGARICIKTSCVNDYDTSVTEHTFHLRDTTGPWEALTFRWIRIWIWSGPTDCMIVSIIMAQSLVFYLWICKR